MKLDFKEFMQWMEMDVANMTTDDIQLKKGWNSYSYDFEVDGDKYSVRFNKYSIGVPGGSYDNITQNSYEITLTGPSGVAPTGKGKPLTIYKHLIKAVKKLLQEANPEGLHFFGAYPEQDIMYAQFYDKYLKPYYTQISHEDYLRNDYLQQLQTTRPDVYQAIQQSQEDHQRDNPVERMRQEKMQRREALQNLAQRMADAVGKIMYLPSDGAAVLVKAINGIQAEVYGSKYVSGQGAQLMTWKVALDQLRNTRGIGTYAAGYVQQMIEALKQSGVNAQPYTGDDAITLGMRGNY